ncbi:hypothetical protein PTKIN_Ptkin07bG0068100 [Pterospermum kingtungense]
MWATFPFRPELRTERLKMGFQHFTLALVVMIMIMIIPNCGRAAVLVKSNTTYHCNGLLNECFIGEDLESELDFFMASNIIRVLKSSPDPITSGTGNRHVKSQQHCRKGVPYDRCIAHPPSGNNYCNKKNVYHRDRC